MAKKISDAARKALAATDWRKIDAMTDADVARQIAANPDAAPDAGARDRRPRDPPRAPA